jgi:hypothetical protein
MSPPIVGKQEIMKSSFPVGVKRNENGKYIGVFKQDGGVF